LKGRDLWVNLLETYPRGLKSPLECGLRCDCPKFATVKGMFSAINEQQIYAQLEEVFQNVFDEDSIQVTPQLSAKGVDGWDSLTHIQLMLAVDRAFKVKFSSSEIDKLENAGDLVGLIKTRT
jgi:acyl carrier protein